MKTTFFLPLILIPGILLMACSHNEGQHETDHSKLIQLKEEVNSELTGNLLPYWSEHMMDTLNGGFYGRIDSRNIVQPEADKGGILHARILWTFSAAFRVLGDSSYLSLAEYAKNYIIRHFIDEEYGGAFLKIRADGQPGDTRKQTLTQSYFIYAFAEYFRATGDSQALALARDIFDLVEKYAYDSISNGYYEVFTRDWKRSQALLIGERSPEDEKTMITHLHLVEAYAGLFRVWPDDRMAGRLRNILEVFNEKIVDHQTYHTIYFLDRDWNPTTQIDSYGHDIEAAWLIVEAAGLLNDPELTERVRELSIKIADAAAEGIRPDGSMLTEKDHATGHIVTLRSWWEQAESVVGFLTVYEITGEGSYLEKTLASWHYIKNHFIDRAHGGWHRFVDETGTPGQGEKAGFWTCPYHNGRMCLEVIERVE